MTTRFCSLRSHNQYQLSQVRSSAGLDYRLSIMAPDRRFHLIGTYAGYRTLGQAVVSLFQYGWL